MTPTEEVLAEYKKTEKVTDSLGRTIIIKRMRPSQEMAVTRMADTELQSILTRYIVAASVQRIDDGSPDPVVHPFPKGIGDIDTVLDQLGNEGMRAAILGYMQLNGVTAEPAKDVEGADGG